MGQCLRSSGIRADTLAGDISRLKSFEYDASTDGDSEFEIQGMPFSHFMGNLCNLGPDGERRVYEQLVSDLSQQCQYDAPQKEGSGGSGGSDRSLTPWTSGSSRGSGSGNNNSNRTVQAVKCARVEVLTWNVGSLDLRKQADDALKVLSARIEGSQIGEDVDIVVVGLQEVISLTLDNSIGCMSALRLSNQDIHFGWPDIVVRWVELLDKSLHTAQPAPWNTPGARRFTLHGQPVFMFGLLLCVFCRAELAGHILHFRKFELPVDSRRLGSKGIVACRFSLYDRSFCFINCHFQALTGHSEVANAKALKERLQQIQECWNDIKFVLNDHLIHRASSHRAVFLIGDTNMRLRMPPSFKSMRKFGDHVRSEIAAGHWKSLQEFDQLTHLLEGASCRLKPAPQSSSKAKGTSSWLTEAREARIWQEPLQDGGTIPFPPSFKLQVPGSGYSTKRVPAWTDRVLFRSHVTRPLLYSAMRTDGMDNLTDHFPVRARFEVDCVMINTAQLSELIASAQSDLDFDSRSDAPRKLTSEQRLHVRNLIARSATPHVEQYSERLFGLLREYAASDSSAADDAVRLIGLTEELLKSECDLLLARVRHSLARSNGETGDMLQLLQAALDRVRAETWQLNAAGQSNGSSRASLQEERRRLLSL